MPKLPNYTAEIPGGVDAGGGRRATAQDFGAPGLGDAGLVGAGHMVQAAAQRQLSDMEEAEARKALIESTQIRAEYARKLDEAALSGADLGKIKEDMVASLTKVGEGFATKKGAEQLALYTANSEIMYDQQANQIAVQRAWSQARLDGQKFVNGASALIQSNPAYLQVAEKDAADFVASFPGIRPDQRDKLTADLKKDLNMAAAMSAARIDPMGTVKRLDGGEWDLAPEQRATARHEAERYDSVKRAAEDRERSRIKEERHDRAVEAFNGYSQRILAGDLSSRLEKDIIADPALAANPQFREHLVTFMRADAKRRAGEERAGDKRLEAQLWLDYTTGKKSSEKWIAQAVQDHLEGRPGLNLAQARPLLAEVQRMRDDNYSSIGQRKGQLLSEFGRMADNNTMLQALSARDPNIVPEMQMEYRVAIDRKLDELRKNDEPLGQVFDPDSKHYVGPGPFTRELIDRFTKSKRNDAVDAAKAAGMVNLQVNPGAWTTLKEGDAAIMPDGQALRVTKKTLEILKRQAAKTPDFPVVPSGETPDKIAAREAARRGAEYSDWQQGLGK